MSRILCYLCNQEMSFINYYSHLVQCYCNLRQRHINLLMTTNINNMSVNNSNIEYDNESSSNSNNVNTNSNIGFQSTQRTLYLRANIYTNSNFLNRILNSIENNSNINLTYRQDYTSQNTDVNQTDEMDYENDEEYDEYDTIDTIDLQNLSGFNSTNLENTNEIEHFFSSYSNIFNNNNNSIYDYFSAILPQSNDQEIHQDSDNSNSTTQSNYINTRNLAGSLLNEIFRNVLTRNMTQSSNLINTSNNLPGQLYNALTNSSNIMELTSEQNTGTDTRTDTRTDTGTDTGTDTRTDTTTDTTTYVTQPRRRRPPPILMLTSLSYTDDFVESLDQSIQDYNFNNLVAELLGKVEVGFTDEQLDNVTLSLKKHEINIDERCPICLDYIGEMSEDNNLRMTKCGHFYCEECIFTWLKKHKTCPFCKIDLEEKYLKETT